MKWLLDTSVYSQPLRRQPIKRALEKWRDAGDSNCAISGVTLGEIHWGLHAAANDRLWDGYHALIADRLSILETSNSIWKKFAEMKARQNALGQPVSDLDLLIAATAAHHRLTIATLNHQDFSRIEGISWEDWSV